MANSVQTDPLLNERILDFCEVIAADAGFTAAHERIRVFEEDDSAQEVYGAWQSLASEIQHRYQHEGVKPSPGQLSELEALQQKVGENPVAADFVEANDSMNALFNDVLKTVQKTFQLGRPPTPEEMAECCGSGG